jgi:hypothetical protein
MRQNQPKPVNEIVWGMTDLATYSSKLMNLPTIYELYCHFKSDTVVNAMKHDSPVSPAIFATTSQSLLSFDLESLIYNLYQTILKFKII